MYFTAPTLSNWKRLILRKSNGGIDFCAFGAWIRRYDPEVFAGRQTLSTPEKVADILGGPEFMIPAVTTMLLLGHHMKNTKFKAMTYSLAQGFVITGGLAVAIDF